MSGQFVGHRFGQDSYPRIATSAEMLLEATEMLPYEPMYQPLVPFVPPSITNGNGNTGAPGPTTDNDGKDVWERYPARLDLTFYQGDDVVIPLYFRDPIDPTHDMSDENEYEWHAQVRWIHTYRSRLITTFTVNGTYIPPVDAVPGATKIEMFLPRADNIYAGNFRWEIYSVAPHDYGDFEAPEDWPVDAIWPPDDYLRTWLYGACTVIPRTTSTDYLPTDQWAIQPPSAGVPGVWTGSFVVGPNGRVP